MRCVANIEHDDIFAYLADDVIEWDFDSPPINEIHDEEEMVQMLPFTFVDPFLFEEETPVYYRKKNLQATMKVKKKSSGLFADIDLGDDTKVLEFSGVGENKGIHGSLQG